MQKAQTRGGNKLLDRDCTVPSTHFPASFPESSNAHQHHHSGSQLRLSFYKLLELSRDLNSSSPLHGRKSQSAGNRKHSVNGGDSAGHGDHTHLPPSRSQRIQRDLQDLSGKHVLDRLSSQTAYVQPLSAWPATVQTAHTNSPLHTVSATRVQQAIGTHVLSRISGPAQKRTCRLHTAPSIRSNPVTSERIQANRSVMPAVLPAQHCKRLSSADPSTAVLHPSSIAKPLLQCRESVIDPPQTGNVQPLQTACTALNTTPPAPAVGSLQPVQLSPTPSQPSWMLTSAMLHKHDASEPTPKQQSRVPSHVSDDELGSESSSGSAFFTDTAEERQSGCRLPGVAPSGVDCEDCMSIGTSQAITDGSSSVGDIGEEAVVVSEGRAGPLMAPSVMGTAPTVAFVGLDSSQDAESDLSPLRYPCCLTPPKQACCLTPLRYPSCLSPPSQTSPLFDPAKVLHCCLTPLRDRWSI